MASEGICQIKAEYILPECPREIDLECVSKKDKESLEENELEKNDVSNPPHKKQRLSKAEKKKLRGQNKARPAPFRRNNEAELCNTLTKAMNGQQSQACQKKNCRFMHDIKEYLKSKPADIGDHCPNFQLKGFCYCGLTCRFGKEHITEDCHNIVDSSKQKQYETEGPHTINSLSQELQHMLRKRLYDFDLSESLVKFNDKCKKDKKLEGSAVNVANQVENGDTLTDVDQNTTKNSNYLSGTVTDEDIIKIKQREKKKIDWSNKLFLSPLTTVGNLPFRRICKEYGVDVTCGEMAMCSSLLRALPQEWALVKRHRSEDIFGVQLCANNPYLLTKCGQLLEQEANIDFIDLNLGCPIEMVYRDGAGSGLLRRPHVLESCVRNLSQILTIPMTVKTRAGIYNNDNIAHTFVSKFRDWGASLVTVHGRSREQRYTKMADWDYIRQCAQMAAPLPVLGNGDVLSYEDYRVALEKCPELNGVMIGRGALMKPWIFTEIKEQKLWDISSSERFDIIKKYVDYGLEHWGSDTKGVENTRRFLLEWLSFLYRYIPVGILERPPQKINERPPYFHGRDDMETLLASPSACDWIKITEMLLGPVPEGFHFLPKHKANSYKAE